MILGDGYRIHRNSWVFACRAGPGRRSYTLDAAAKALGLSRRMVAYYDRGDKPVPRVVALAAQALELARRNPRRCSARCTICRP
jgi:hypothetical protein